MDARIDTSCGLDCGVLTITIMEELDCNPNLREFVASAVSNILLASGILKRQLGTPA